MWRVGENYEIHVYEGPKPGSRAVATFHHPDDAKRCVYAVNCVAELEAEVARLKGHAEAMAEAIAPWVNTQSSPYYPNCERAFNAYRRDYPGGEPQCRLKH